MSDTSEADGRLACMPSTSGFGCCCFSLKNTPRISSLALLLQQVVASTPLHFTKCNLLQTFACSKRLSSLGIVPKTNRITLRCSQWFVKFWRQESERCWKETKFCLKQPQDTKMIHFRLIEMSQRYEFMAISVLEQIHYRNEQYVFCIDLRPRVGVDLMQEC